MRREYITDRLLTEARYKAGIYQDSASYVCLDGREVLSGADVTARRRQVYDRDGGYCVTCGKFLTFEQFEMDHRIKRSELRDDRLENLAVKCGQFGNGCHRGSKFAKHK
jgi:hypothetical protein